jgi:hypothetical protein
LYFNPLFLLILAKVFEDKWDLRWMVWGLLAWLLPQYAFAYHLNKNYDYAAEIGNYRKMIPPDSLPILGGPNAWFAFPSRDFYFNRYLGDFQKLGLSRFYLIEDEGYLEKPEDTAKYIQAHFKSTALGEFPMNRERFLIALEEMKEGIKP